MPRIRADSIEAHKTLSRAMILAAAEAAFAESEYSAVGLAEIADAAGVARTTLYEYFPSKDELVVGLIADRAEPLLSRLVQGLSEEGSHTERLVELLSKVIRLVVSEPSLTWLIFRVGRKLPKDQQDQMWEAMGAVETEIHSVCRSGVAAGEFAPGDPETLARVCSDLLIGAIEEIVRRHESGDLVVDDVIDGWVGFMARGVALPG